MKALLLCALLAVSSQLFADDLRGHVVATDGKPLIAAHVYVYEALPRSGPNTLCPSCYRDCGKHEAVAADGAFALRELDPKLQFKLLAVASGYEPSFSDFTPGASDVTLTLNPRPASDGEHLVCGTVVDPEGKPVIGALVEPAGVHLVGIGTGYGKIPGVDSLSITDANGEFALRLREDASALDVRVRSRKYAPVIHRMLKPGELRTLHVTPGAAVSGRVVSDGHPAAGSIVKVEQLLAYSSEYLGTMRIATDESGRFNLGPLGPNEMYIVSVVTDTTVPKTLAKKVVEVDGDMTTEDAGTIELQR
jgi:hypothetical protein